MGLSFDADGSLLIIIDTQPGFLSKLPAAEAADLVGRVAWIAAAAQVLGVPIVVTEEEPARHGATDPAVVAAVGDERPRHNKATFGLANTEALVEVVSAFGRRSAVLCGLETDVCVAQSALGLVELGWKVAVLVDAVGARGTAHAQGLERMRNAGVALLGLKGLYYEWVRSVERLSLPGLTRVAPPGIVL